MKYLILIFLSVFLSAQTVYKTPSGEKYHLSSCRMVKNVSSTLTIDKALEIGLTPCSFCNPPFKQNSGKISKVKKTPGTNSQNQCFATTQKGSRCKRKTTIGNNFCFQHLP